MPALEPLHPDLSQLIAELGLLLQESAEVHPVDSPTGELLRGAVRWIGPASRLLRDLEGRYVVALVGQANVGKSTLLNALLGSRLAPERNGPCTAAPVEFAAGDARRIVIYDRDRVLLRRSSCATDQELREQLTTVVNDPSGAASGQVERVLVELPNPLLAGRVVLSDTPGFGAASEAATQHAHDGALRGYLSRCASQVVWVVRAEPAPGKAEFDFFRTQLASRCRAAVATAADDFSPRDKQRFQDLFARELGVSAPHVQFVSGRLGLRAIDSGDSQQLADSGVLALRAWLQEFAQPARRRQQFFLELEQFANDLSHRLSQIATAGAAPWRSDSWSRWLNFRAAPELLLLKAQLTEWLSEGETTASTYEGDQ